MKYKFLSAMFAFSVALNANLPVFSLTLEEGNLNAARDAVVKKDYKHAAEKFKVMAAKGCPYSNCILGIMYQKGLGVQQNVKEAIAYYQRSAAMGFMDAQLHLGRLYESAESGAFTDKVAATKWFHEAAEHGSAEAQLWLGKMYLASAKAEPKKMALARHWLKRAADQGVGEAKTLFATIENTSPTAGGNSFVADNDTGSPVKTVIQSWQGYGSAVQALESGTQN